MQPLRSLRIRVFAERRGCKACHKRITQPGNQRPGVTSGSPSSDGPALVRRPCARPTAESSSEGADFAVRGPEGVGRGGGALVPRAPRAPRAPPTPLKAHPAPNPTIIKSYIILYLVSFLNIYICGRADLIRETSAELA